MAFSLSSKPFLGAANSDASSGLGSVNSGFRKLSSPPTQISFRRTPRKFEVHAAGSTYGNYFRVTTYGESHGGGVGCVVDGCPPRLPLREEDLQIDLDRRRPGQSRITTPRKETDTCKIISGVAEGVTTGSPIAVNVPNTDQRGHDYSEMSIAYRPSHADATYDFKYGVRSIQGGGRSSARETIGRVAAGAIAKKILKKFSGTEVLAYVSQVHKVVLPDGLVNHETLALEQKKQHTVYREQGGDRAYCPEERHDPLCCSTRCTNVEAMVALVCRQTDGTVCSMRTVAPSMSALQGPHGDSQLNDGTC
ncbi:hypothetical protein Cgig2_009512 [Carnegiea gigantea]|uniref:Chorismate synthase n=1 Tax=Carnegiea gigantea TaxID=171969 RepID=A0A9Q1JK11_9CARY|nr:hypothetical protein Cgig2_009512 [Carnegiea gigantea]